MSKLDRYIELNESVRPAYTAEDVRKDLKPFIRRRFPKSFSKVEFDKTENGNGILFVKFSKTPWMEGVDNETLKSADANFIISIEGFDSEGNNGSDYFQVEMIDFKNDSKKIKKLAGKEFYNLSDAKNYVKKYFNYFSEELLDEDDEEPRYPRSYEEGKMYYNPDDLHFASRQNKEENMTIIYAIGGPQKGQLWVDYNQNANHPNLIKDSINEYEGDFPDFEVPEDEELNERNLMHALLKFMQETKNYLFARVYDKKLAIWEPGRRVLKEKDSVWLSKPEILKSLYKELKDFYPELDWKSLRWTLSHDRDIYTKDIVDGGVKSVQVGSSEKAKEHAMSPMDPRKTKIKSNRPPMKTIPSSTGKTQAELRSKKSTSEDVEEDVSVAGGTHSGATSYGEGGDERTTGSIAVKPYHAGVYKRSGRVDKKKKKK